MRWREIVIAALLILCGMLIAKMCQRSPVTAPNYQASIDSLKRANVQQAAAFKAKGDSIDKIVEKKDESAQRLQSRLDYISAKYLAMRNAEPDRDTVVRVVEVFDGKECIEKLPIIQAQLSLSQSVVVDLKHKIVLKDQQIVTIQDQFTRAVGIGQDQEKEIKKLKRKAKWNRFLIYGEAIVGIGAIIYLSR